MSGNKTGTIKLANTRNTVSTRSGSMEAAGPSIAMDTRNTVATRTSTVKSSAAPTKK